MKYQGPKATDELLLWDLLYNIYAAANRSLGIMSCRDVE